MELYKEEAKRAMDIAERKITEKDYIGAKVFANNAQNLYPHLDGLKQFLIMVEVYISAEKNICGEPDWYGILGVEHSADDEAIRKHYNNLVIMLHPDKNKCTGAEGAFKLLSEAWSLLSDQMCRSLYNFRRQKSDHKSSPTERWIPLYYPTLNGILSVREDVVLGAIARTKHGADMDRLLMDSNSFISSIQTENGTFWTKCEECQIKYQYERVYLNMYLRCTNCHMGFLATERTPPASVSDPVNLSSNHQCQSSKNQERNKNLHDTSSWIKSTPSRKAYSKRRNTLNKGLNVVKQAQKRLKRKFGKSQDGDAVRRFTNCESRKSVLIEEISKDLDAKKDKSHN